MKDKFGRELKENDICFRVVVQYTSRSAIVKVNIVRIDRFTMQKVKIGEKVFVDSTNLILASPDGLII